MSAHGRVRGKLPGSSGNGLCSDELHPCAKISRDGDDAIQRETIFDTDIISGGDGGNAENRISAQTSDLQIPPECDAI